MGDLVIGMIRKARASSSDPSCAVKCAWHSIKIRDSIPLRHREQEWSGKRGRQLMIAALR